MMVPQQQRRRRRRSALPRTSERRIVVARGVGGFGFTIAGQRPCVVSAVAAGGPAERAGLRAGDALLAVDGANVSRALHASVARLVSAAPGAISLSVALREAPPTDTEDTEPDERSRARRRHPPPRRRAYATHHPVCHADPSASGVSDILQNLSRAQLTSTYAARLECRAVVGYLGTIETPQAAPSTAPGNVRTAVRKLRQERRPAAPVLLSVLPSALLLRRANGQILAQYHRERIVYAGCGSEADRRFFGLVTAAEMSEAEASHSCHVFAVDPRMAEHATHAARAREFQVTCTSDAVAERCLEFPPSAEYVVGVIRGMYSLPPDDNASPTLQQLSKLTIKGDSPAMGNFARFNRPPLRLRDRRYCGHQDGRLEDHEFDANSPQPSNHSEMTTTSSNSDSGIGFHNDGRNIADRILVVDFAGQQLPTNKFRQEIPPRPVGIAGCSNFDADGSLFLSNTMPLVDGFGGQGRPLNLDDYLNANDLQPVRRMSPHEEDSCNIYSNMPSTSQRNNHKALLYDQVYTENEGVYELLPPQYVNAHLDVDNVSEQFNPVEIFAERSQQQADLQSNESVENVTVISGTSKASMDSVSMYSTRSHEEVRSTRSRHLQASLDDMLVLGLRDPSPDHDKDKGIFVHPASVKCKVRKSLKPLNLLSKTKNILIGRGKKLGAHRTISASAGDVTKSEGEEKIPSAASEPDLRDVQSEESSPFRRWTTGSGASSSHREADQENIFHKPITGEAKRMRVSGWRTGHGVTRWSLGLDQLLADPMGAAAFAHFLDREFATENIRFWSACEKYKSLSDGSRRAEVAHVIWERHLSEGAPEPVNVDSAAKNATKLHLKEIPPPEDLFLVAQNQIFQTLKFDSYPRFLKSDVHSECARAELVGRPIPFAIQPIQLDLPPSKVKKSSSNASDRRRSGSTLLPWRRGASNERHGSSSDINVGASTSGAGPSGTCRAASALAGSATKKIRDKKSDPKSVNFAPTKYYSGPGSSSTSSSADSSPIKDMVRLINSGPSQNILCRVILPDGATSVVNVDPAITVGGMIKRLMSRRNLFYSSYDILVRDDTNSDRNREDQSQRRLINANEPSTEVGGCEVFVAKRVVVRMDIGGRVVAIRCRPMRQLKQALSPVIEKYAPDASNNIAVMYNGEIVDLDLEMECYDGEKLELVDFCNQADDKAAKIKVELHQRQKKEPASDDGDADSLSDLALLKIDDNSQEPHATSSALALAMALPPRRLPVTHGPWSPSAKQTRILPEPIIRVHIVVLPGAGAGVSRASTAAPAWGRAQTQPARRALPHVPVGRVRASMRQGAPLHHHPPVPADFLKNLRDTQRQKLHKRGASELPEHCAAHAVPLHPPPPPPPPPLPPKPTRHVTFV